MVQDGCLRFEAEIATITLIPDANGLPTWELKYRAKEPMFNDVILPHPKEVFTIPQTLFNGDVLFPYKHLRLLMMLITGSDELPPEGYLDVLNHDYCEALNDGALICEETELMFKTRIKTQAGASIQVVIEPDYYAPIPNTWKLTEFRCSDEQKG